MEDQFSADGLKIVLYMYRHETHKDRAAEKNGTNVSG